MAIDPEVGQHRVFVMDRGGDRRIAELTGINRVIWNRVRDDMSDAEVNLSADSASRQISILRDLVRATGRYEIVIWRGEDRVWEGPITLVTFHRNGVDIAARDIMLYARNTVIHGKYSNAYPNIGYVTTRAKTILAAELARKEALSPPINVVSRIVEHHKTTDAKTSAVTLPYQTSLFDHIDSLAQRSGMDYTVLGRAIHLWDTNQPAMGYTPTMTEADFLGEVYLSVYGMELATRSVVSDGNGAYAVAGTIDPYYGEIERMAAPFNESGGATPTSAELMSQAQRNLAGRKPTPIQLRIPDNSALNLSGKFTIKDLVPGVYVPLRATVGLVNLSQMQKLQTVRVTETEDGEEVTVTLYPASADDDTGEE